MPYMLVTDSNCDLHYSYYKQNRVLMVNMRGMISSEEFSDDGGENYDIPTFYNRLRNGEIATTTQITTQRFIDELGPIMESGCDILYLSFSSGLSATYQSAVLASEELMSKYPGRAMRVVDSLAASAGQGLLLHLAVTKRNEGMPYEELGDLLENTKYNVQQWFTPSDLHFLKRGGRVSASAALLGTMLDIKPVLHVDHEGHLIPMSKVKGRRKALRELADKLVELAVDPGQHPIFISHADALADAELVAQMIRERIGACEIMITYIGPVIGAHAGPATIALFFVGKDRRLS